MRGLILLILVLFSFSGFGKERLITMGLPYHHTRNAAIVEYIQFLTDSLNDADFKVRLETFQSKRPYDLLVNKQIDSIGYDDLAISEGRDHVITLPFPIVFTYARIFYRADNKDFDVKKLKDYRGALSQNNTVIDKAARARSLKYITAGTPFHCVQLLLDRKVDYFLALEEVGLSSIDSMSGAKGKILMSNEVFVETPTYFTFSTSLAKDEPKIEAAFRKRLQGDLSAYPLLKNHLNATLRK